MRKIINQLGKYINHLDPIIMLGLLALLIINTFIQYSANDGVKAKLYSDLIYLFLSLILMLVIANINYRKFKTYAIFIYCVSMVLLFLVLIMGTKINGAKRWLDLGLRIQPSEISKLSVPIFSAFLLAKKELMLRKRDFIAVSLMILLTGGMIAQQPDLGTAILVWLSGFFVLFYAGLSWGIIILALSLFLITTPISWYFLHAYQKARIMMLIDPFTDPLGKGYHIIQGIIAIGSGGLRGKGYLQGTQVHLNFIPEKHTDSVITVLAEEFGYIGILVLLIIYALIFFRCLKISFNTEDFFARILAAAITMSFLSYIAVNMGMVAGIFPVVGVPLPLISYGGSSSFIIMIGFGIILAINKDKKG